jgi:hypothetical protein
VAELLGTAPVDGRGDFDNSGVIDLLDLRIVVNAYYTGVRTAKALAVTPSTQEELDAAVTRWEEVYPGVTLTQPKSLTDPETTPDEGAGGEGGAERR